MPPKGKPKAKPKQVKKNFPEHDLQVKCVNWLKTNYPDAVYCSTQGGIDQTNVSRIRMVQAGYVKGIPDLMIYSPSFGYNGLAIEFKIGNNVPSEFQKEWKIKLEERCLWCHHYVYDYETFTEIVMHYFNAMDVVVVC